MEWDKPAFLFQSVQIRSNNWDACGHLGVNSCITHRVRRDILYNSSGVFERCWTGRNHR